MHFGAQPCHGNTPLGAISAALGWPKHCKKCHSIGNDTCATFSSALPSFVSTSSVILAISVVAMAARRALELPYPDHASGQLTHQPSHHKPAYNILASRSPRLTSDLNAGTCTFVIPCTRLVVHRKQATMHPSSMIYAN